MAVQLSASLQVAACTGLPPPLLSPPAVPFHTAAERRRTRTGVAAVACSLRADPPARRGAGADGGELCTLDASLEDAVQLKRHAEDLEKLRSRILQVDKPVEAMATVNTLQRLGIDYHFEEEVGTLLNYLYESFTNGRSGGSSTNLHDVSLSFRLLRQGGFHVPTDVFDRFADGQGGFEQSLSKDIPGILSLYEASYLGVGEELVLDQAQAFCHEHLRASMGWLEPRLAQQVKDALDHPYHTSLQRYKSRTYLEHFDQMRSGTGDVLLGRLARLDFNIVQSLHRSEFLKFSRWWKDLGLSQDVVLARNQPLKWYMWSLAILSDPKFSDYRIEITKCITLVYIIDDIFDVYGSLDELVLFTQAIKKWDSLEVDTLPSYMRMCYTTLCNVTNEIAHKVYKEHGWNPISSLRKSWIMLFDAFLVEARWFGSRHIPMTDEYLRNGVISSGMHVVLTHIFFLLGHNLTMDNITCLEDIPSLISIPATILRLWDDLGSAKDENQNGFDGSYIQSHIREHDNCSIISARKHVMDIIFTSWKRLNKAVLSSKSFSPAFLVASLNSARMIRVMYSYEDNQRLPMLEKFINLLLFEYV